MPLNYQVSKLSFFFILSNAQLEIKMFVFRSWNSATLVSGTQFPLPLHHLEILTSICMSSSSSSSSQKQPERGKTNLIAFITRRLPIQIRNFKLGLKSNSCSTIIWGFRERLCRIKLMTWGNFQFGIILGENKISSFPCKLYKCKKFILRSNEEKIIFWES